MQREEGGERMKAVRRKVQGKKEEIKKKRRTKELPRQREDGRKVERRRIVGR